MKRPLHVLAAALIVLGGCASDGEVRLACSSPPEGMDAYWAGSSFEGLDLTYAMTNCDTPGEEEVTTAREVSFSYGDCPPRGGGCALPISIQTWPAQARPRPQLPGTNTSVNGVPATLYGGGHLEIYHPDVTVVIFGDDGARVKRFSRALVEAPHGSEGLAAEGLELEFHRPAGSGWNWPLALAVALFAVSLAVGRWWLLIVPLVGLPVLFVGTYFEWWFFGLGEGWQLGFILALAVGVVAVTAGVLLHRPVLERFSPS